MVTEMLRVMRRINSFDLLIAVLILLIISYPVNRFYTFYTDCSEAGGSYGVALSSYEDVLFDHYCEFPDGEKWWL